MRMPNGHLAPAAAWSLFLVMASSALAEDWPQFKRTADRQGRSLSEQVSFESKVCCWIDFGSPIIAPATIVKGKAYVVSSRGLLARVNLASNSVDWQVSLGGVNNESTPSVENGKVYVGSTAGSFYVLNAETGEILKKYPAGDAVLASPLLYKGSVYFGSADGVFHALDATGNRKWTYKTEGTLLYSAAADGEAIIVSDGLTRTYWLADKGTRADLVRSTPRTREGAIISHPVAYDGRVYVHRSGGYGGGELICFGAATDTHEALPFKSTGTREKLPFGLPGSIYGWWTHASLSVDTATGRVFIPTARGGLWAVGGGFAGWTTNNGGRPGGAYGVNCSPAVVGNCVIFGDENGRINFCQKEAVTKSNYGGANVLWHYALKSGKAVEASPAVSDGRVVIGGLDGCLYGFWNGPEVKEPIKIAR